MVVDGSLHPSPTTDDLDMLDSTTAEQRRPSLSTSLSDFALFPTSSAPSSPSATTPEDVLNPLFRRIRRSSLLATHPITAEPDGKSGSPLATSFTPRFNFDMGKLASDTASEPSPTTPSLLFASAPSTPPRATSPDTRRRPPKPARLLDLRNELRSPIESELKSEAQFQRLIASYAYTGFPPNKHLPRTPRAWADRGRYPEEAGGDEEGSQGGESASDDGEESTGASASATASATASVSMTPSGSGSGSGEEQAMTIDTAIVGPFMMDVDIPSTQSALNSPTQWRQTPPPTLSGVRPNKRKFDDRYDPYPTAAKRRAVSPSVHVHHSHSHHTHSHPHSHSHSLHHPRSGSMSHVSPISIPVPRTARSVTSSPVLHPTSSPILRPMSFPGHSPVLKGASPTVRPIARLTLGERERERSQRGVDGAGEAVGSLSIT